MALVLPSSSPPSTLLTSPFTALPPPPVLAAADTPPPPHIAAVAAAALGLPAELPVAVFAAAPVEGAGSAPGAAVGGVARAGELAKVAESGNTTARVEHPMPELGAAVPADGACVLVALHELVDGVRADVMEQVRAFSRAVFFEDDHVLKAGGTRKRDWQLDVVIDVGRRDECCTRTARAGAKGGDGAADDGDACASAALPIFGFILYRVGGDTGAKGICGISKLWVHTAVRRRGLGRKLVRCVVSWAKRQKCDFVTLWSYDDAIKFYRSLGFKLGDSDPKPAAAEGTFHNEVSHYMERFVGKRGRRGRKGRR